MNIHSKTPFNCSEDFIRLRHYRKNHGRSIHFMYISLHLHYIAKTCRMRIPMSWDVIQSNTNSFQSLHRPFATFNAKQRDLESWDTCFAEACAKMVQKIQNSNFHFLVHFFFSKINIGLKSGLRYVFSISNTRFFAGDV